MVERVRTTSSDDRPAPRSTQREIKLLEQLEEGLKIDEHALDEALQQQPDLFYRVSKELALLTSRRDAAKHELTLCESDADSKIRRKAAKAGDKITEREVDAMKRVDADVAAATQDLLQLNSMVAQFSALKEAFQQRSYVLKDLANLYVANYYGSNPDATTSRVKNADAQHARREMARGRRDYAGGR